MNVFDFSIETNVISLLFEMTNAKGQQIFYPSYTKLVEAAYEYIIGKFESTKKRV